MADKTVTVYVEEVITETERALLVLTDDGDQIWIPKSQIDDDSEVWSMGQAGDLIISEWIAKQKGLV